MQERTPAEEIVQPVGSDPLARVQVYGLMPPVTANCCEYAVPTVAVRAVVIALPDSIVSLASRAGTVSVMELLIEEFAAETAVMVTVCAEVVAAGAV